MKTKFTALALITAAALSLAPKPAAASDKGLAVVGGLIGGLIIASAINDHCDDNRTTVVYSNGAGCDDRRDGGYWSTVSVNVWVPGCWVIERSHHGRDYRRYVGGHYEVRPSRVWVASNRHDYRHDRREDRRDDRREDRSDRRDYRR